MKVSILKNDKILNYILPKQIHGNYWITDKLKNGKERNLINIVENNGKWEMISNNDVTIFDENGDKETVILDMDHFYSLKIKNEDTITYIYCGKVYDDQYVQLSIKNAAEFFVGKNEKCQISYKNELIENEHIKIVYKNEEWYINELSEKNLIYINNERIKTQKINNGDVIFAMGLKMIFIKNNIIINQIGKIKVDGNLFTQSSFPKQIVKKIEEVDDEEIVLYKESDYFFKSPRFRNNPDRVTLPIDQAPAKPQEDNTPVLYSLGPMLTMGMTSMVSAFTAISSVVQNGRPVKEALPSVIMAVAMLATMILWPMLQKNYKKKQTRKQEKERREKYTAYIESKRAFIRNVIQTQTTALIENFPPLEEIKKIILFRKTNLWEREIDQDDFLRVRVGIGTLPVNMDIQYPEEHFTMLEDDLKDITNVLVNDSKDLVNVPITVSFFDKYISALVGETPIIEKISYGFILQLIAYHSYDDLKLVFFTSEEKEHYWDFAKVLPHCWNEDKTMRYFAKNADDMKQISSALITEFQARTFKKEDGTISAPNKKRNKPYYFIVVDDFKTARDMEIIKAILDQNANVGFSILVLNDKLTNLPNECMSFICIGHSNKAVIFEDELVTNKQKRFTADVIDNLNLEECAAKLANIPIDTVKENNTFPKKISFLEMYNVGKVEQLNSYNRWEVNLPVNSLQAPLGVDKQGNIFKLDLHEKFHGPHGLIAGMTGSGKSELIITYILSMAVNYHPNDVSFIIIDYKGGGVALAFENKEIGKKLPHIAGTITNLDTAELNRALISIDSELRRRQKVFNDARVKSNESTIDIYKYQKLYKNGVVTEPVSHLFIICDEFAELKMQQPDFMDQLISTARIGRSLGVHLILATQKPSGIVNDQIWSNSRFRICLKVQEKQDSMDMIKTPEAAMIKNVGRFYLQVGYNEFFAEGLAAWSGAQYIPSDKPKKKVDNSINFIDNVGYAVKSIDDEKTNALSSAGEQLTSIVNYLTTVAKEDNIEIKQLWLDKIPALIYVDDLANKYSYKTEKFEINPIIGEYDDPANQLQGLLTVNLSVGGNAIVYGTSGSGKTTFLSSIIYSTIVNHTAEEVNFYIMDFGAETFRMFKNAPQVGDVLFISDVEKISNLFKKLFDIIAERKKLFSNYNGSFSYYNKKAEKKVPLIIVTINNYEAFIESFQSFEDTMLQLTRDGLIYGIVFLISATNTNTIRYKFRQNFKQEFVLQLNDVSDYTFILGNTKKLYPSKIYGRGLVGLDKIYEFQTAHPCVAENFSECILTLCEKLKKETAFFAEPVAILPDIVTTEDINAKFKGISSVPIGVNKNTLEPSTWNFKDNIATLVSGLEYGCFKFFIKPLISQFTNLDCNIMVFDAISLAKNMEKKDNLYYYETGFDAVINSMNNGIMKQKDFYQKNNFNREIFTSIKPMVCVVIGVDSFLMKMMPETKMVFENLIVNDTLLHTIKFIFIDSIDIFKKLEYDNWYKAIVKSNQGIWLGNGITEQYAIKVAKITRELQADLDEGFGYVVKRGQPVLTKFLTSQEGYKGDSDE